MSGQESDKNNVGGGVSSGGVGGVVSKTTSFPMDLASKAIVKSNENKGATVQAQQTFRTIAQPQMRVVTMPAGTVQTTGTTQIIQTHLMPQGVLKQVTSGGRTQITALPTRSLSNTSITVTRPVTPTTYHVARGATVTNISGSRGTVSVPLRAQTPPTANVANLGQNFVRGQLPRAPSPAGTAVLSGGQNTWVTSSGPVQVQVPTQLLRTGINQSPRPTRVVTQSTSSTGNTTSINTITNVVHQSSNQQQQQQGSGQQQAFVATLATVLPPRGQATLVYSNVANPQQQQYAASAQRLAVTASLGGQRQVRPLQISNVRPTGTGIRVGNVTSASISLRQPNVPVLAQTNVLTTMPSTGQTRPAVTGNQTTIGSGTGSTNLSTLPQTRIIQVQQPSGTAQVLGTRNLMTLHPVIMNTGVTRSQQSLTAKVQPSLTITHVNKFPQQSSVSTVNTSTSNVTSNLPPGATFVASAGGTQQVVTTVTGQQGQQTAQLVSVNPTTGQSQTHQIVTVSQHQLLQSQQQGSGVPTVATVVPLSALTSRTTNVLTGTLNSLSSGSGQRNPGTTAGTIGTTIVPIGKVIPQQSSNSSNETMQVQQTSSGNVYIHATRSPSTTTATILPSNTGVNVSGTTTFLPTGSTFFYEHAPPSQNNNSGNHLTTVSSSNISNLATGIITSGNMPYTPSASSFAVVPSSNRGQIHNVVTSGGLTTGQLQTVPVRFNPQLLVDSNNHTTSGQQHQQQHHQAQIITMTQQAAANLQNATLVAGAQSQQQQTHMIIPVSAKLTASPRPSILRKRENELTTSGTNYFIRSPLKAAKNLGPALLSMSSSSSNLPSISATIATVAAGGGNSTTGSITLLSTATANQAASISHLMHDNIALNTTATTTNIVNNTINTKAINKINTTLQKNNNNSNSNNNNKIYINDDTDSNLQLTSPPPRRDSSDGSTTVSATSSPSLDQQEHEEMLSMRLNNDLPYKPVDDMYHHQQIIQQQQHNTMHLLQQQQLQHRNSTGNNSTTSNVTTTSSNSSNNLENISPRKKPRKQQLQHQNEHNLTMFTSSNIYTSNNHTADYRQQQHQQQHRDLPNQQQRQQQQQTVTAASVVAVSSSLVNNNISNKENSQPGNYSLITTNDGSNNNNNLINVSRNTVQGQQQQQIQSGTGNGEITIKKPRTCSLLEGYKQNWKPANNHFQRYTDVKPREERRPSVMDLANQAHVVQKVNGWKIYHLSAQMEDLCDLEKQIHDKLTTMLQFMESHEQNSDVERVNDLLKGNMQRSKVIIDGVHEANQQILKIFDHKSHVSDIIHRCASKRNFKKREKF